MSPQIIAVGVVQVYHDQNWVSNFCPHLDNYYLSHILPETLSQKIQAELHILTLFMFITIIL